MCGIAGIFRQDRADDDLDVVRRMLVALRRRGPDDEGLFQDGPVTLGHRRLAILDLTAAARQPMHSPDGRWVVCYNGEIYNFQDLREELGLAADALRTRSDTEILLLAWARWGEAALERLVGQFAFALLDRVAGRMWLVRDRFGEKPLFYHRSAQGLAFASNIEALLQVPWIHAELDPAALAEYVGMRYVVSPRTVLRGIHKLPPGSLLVMDRERLHEPRSWYRLPCVANGDGSRHRGADEAAERFGELLMQATRRCMVSDVPVGLLLSDGIDSNSIAATMRLAGLECPTFTYHAAPASAEAGKSPADRDEAVQLRATPEHRLQMLVPALRSLTEPVGDGAAMATWWLIHSGRARATVFLCGHGGDEVVGGYRLSQDRFRLACLRWLTRVLGSSLDPAVARFTNGLETVGDRRRALARAAAADVPAVARYLIHRPLPAENVRSLFHPNLVEEPYLATVDRLYAECAAADDLDRMQHVMLRTFLSENILTFADSVAMDSSAELRMPFLDRDLVEFVLTLSSEHRVGRRPGRTNTKRILRRWGRKHLPPEILTRRKRPFASGSLRDLLVLPSDPVRGMMLEQPAVRRALPGLEAWSAQGPEIFPGPWEGTLWAVLALAIWCDALGVK